MRTKIVLIIVLSLAALFIAGCGQTTRQTSQSSSNAQQAQTRVPAYFRDVARAGALPPTLEPERFIGPAKDAYKVAREIPATLAQLSGKIGREPGAGRRIAPGIRKRRLLKRLRIERQLDFPVVNACHRLVCATVGPEYERASSPRAEAELEIGTERPMKKDSARRA